jgi:large conductance mechanosensitive channel
MGMPANVYAGKEINPPPPAIESMNPAKKTSGPIIKISRICGPAFSPDYHTIPVKSVHFPKEICYNGPEVNINMKIVKEFKEFAMRGNVIDLAVGVIIGGAFGKIVTSLVNDILMPFLSIITGGVNFADLKIILVQAQGDKLAVALKYGQFLQNIIDFLIIAFAIFVIIKMMNATKKKVEAVQSAKLPDLQIELLEDIRNLLRKNK